MVLIKDASASAQSDIGIRFNSTSANYESYISYGAYTTAYSVNNFLSEQANHDQFYIATLSTNAASKATGYLFLTGGAASGVKAVHYAANGTPATGNGQAARVGGGFWNNSATVTSVSVLSTSGNFDNGTIFVYTSA